MLISHPFDPAVSLGALERGKKGNDLTSRDTQRIMNIEQLISAALLVQKRLREALFCLAQKKEALPRK